MSGPKLRRCSRCGKRCRNFAAAEEWNATVERSAITEVVCPRCQTALENAEATVNEATLDYTNIGGLFVGRPKIGGA